MSDLLDDLSCVTITSLLRDSWVSLVTWSAQQSGGRPLGLRHDEGGVEARMCPKAPRLSLRIIVVRGSCPVLVRIEAFVT